MDAVTMLGGGKIKKIFAKQDKSMSVPGIVVILMVLFILRALVVQLAYNRVAPKLLSNIGRDEDEFNPLNFSEALLLTILISFLFM
jgi:hypothetical protein